MNRYHKILAELGAIEHFNRVLNPHVGGQDPVIGYGMVMEDNCHMFIDESKSYAEGRDVDFAKLTPHQADLKRASMDTTRNTPFMLLYGDVFIIAVYRADRWQFIINS